MFKFIKQYYQLGLYNADDIKLFALAGMITNEEMNNILAPR